MTPVETLMLRVQENAGAVLATLGRAGHDEGFWAALTANESSGYLHAIRYEPAIYRHLMLVRNGLHIADTEGGVVHTAPIPHWLAAAPDSAVLDFARSWGWTQVMGYHAAERARPVEDLRDSDKHYALALALMNDFVARFKLDPRRDFEAMARCWNAGHPTGVTFDPNYVSNLQARIHVWRDLPARGSPPATVAEAGLNR